MLRNDAMDWLMSVGACGWTEKAGVEDRGEALVGKAKVSETGEC